MKFSDTLSTMPPLHHTMPGQPYATERSQVIAWITTQPGFLEWAFQKARDTGRIEYEKATGKWHGVVRRHKAEPAPRNADTNLRGGPGPDGSAPPAQPAATPTAPAQLTEEL